ncbi:phytoene/squalene synthase family protein [Bacillus sp. HMF5848]|uniref:phytoene/squalene synthase family protein n=1 Tax=Bacillus sp. HMF5848 TaxID=2495421 RepID=UPI000F776172|nr:phytoene/squalene synthase family protein [Bacillus sp. HMF5848]RSK26389.1 phytoene/squalene synthase family protein [Bacillus sp. HMF5848]
MDKLKHAYDICEAIIKENSKTFYKAFSFLPAKQKRAVWAIYAFCRTVDDIVDEGEQPLEGLQQFEHDFNTFLSGQLPNDNVMWVALQDVFQSYDMNEQAFHDMIKGQSFDLVKKEYETLNEVLDYSYHVASTVGLMLLPVLAPGKFDRLRESAIKLGLAMQLTNILRDIGEDLERGRVYIPKDVSLQYRYSEGDLHSRVVNAPFVHVWEHLANIAEELYAQSFEDLGEYPLYSRTPVKGAGILYRSILDEIRKNHYNVFSNRNFVSSATKAKLLAQM